MSADLKPAIDEGPALARVFSGHESFPCRFGWLPKLYQAVLEDPHLFSDDHKSILHLGLGRNMIKSIRFWGSAFGVTEYDSKQMRPTQFGRRLLDPKSGHDPYLEKLGSLWRLHWQISAHGGLGAWTTLFLDYKDSQITRSHLIERVQAQALTIRGSITDRTAGNHVDMLIQTYDDRSPQKANSLDVIACPLQELRLLRTYSLNGELMIEINRGAKPSLSTSDLAFALLNYATQISPGSAIVSLRSLLLGRRGLGVIFRLDESSLFIAAEKLAEEAGLSLQADGVGGINFVINEKSRALLDDFAWASS